MDEKIESANSQDWDSFAGVKSHDIYLQPGSCFVVNSRKA